MNFIESVQRWLTAKHINVPTDWLEACIEWITEENQGRVLNQQQVNELVFEQWLLSDLHELGTSCLPSEVTSAEKFQLNGMFALQVDSMVDVSQSCYSQIQKVTGTENANTEVSAETYKPWEPKPSRMLMLKLTDGTYNIQGMEYGPISCLNSKLRPGCKIQIQGRILCRRGMLMLKGENVSILGGEVDTLIEANTIENVLKSTLENNLTHADSEYRQDFGGGPTVNVKQEKKPPVQPQNRSSNSRSMPGYQAPNQQVKTEQTIKTNGDEFEDDLPLEALMDDEMDDFDDELSAPVNQTQNSFRTSTNSANQNTNSNNRTTNPTSFVQNNLQQKNQTVYSNRGQSSNSNYSNRPTQANSLNNDQHDINFMEDDFDMDDDFDMNDEFERQVLSSSDVNVQKLQTESCPNVSKSKKRQLISPLECENNKRRSLLSSHDTDYSKADGHADRVLEKRPLFRSPQIQVEQEGGLDVELMEDVEDKTIGEQLKSSQEVDLSYDPWTYLSVIKKLLPTQQLVCFKVKAYISTLTGKLECPDSKRWVLHVKINDGTASMDVDLSDKVLADLIGFTAQESQKFRRLARQDATTKNKLVNGIKGCQEKLIKLLCIMELQISPQAARPEVVSLVQISHDDISVLADRISKKMK